MLDATEFGDDCVNAPLISRINAINLAKMSESCLYLNVWAPATSAPQPADQRNSTEDGEPGGGERRTRTRNGNMNANAGAGAGKGKGKGKGNGKGVLLWIHGGSFTSGGTSTYSMDPMFAYKRDMVVVTANYRVGAFGWLGGEAVQRSSPDGSSGNFGLQDTREALRWVRRNIAGFGGVRAILCCKPRVLYP